MTKRKVILGILIGVLAIPIILIIAGNLYVALAPPSMWCGTPDAIMRQLEQQESTWPVVHALSKFNMDFLNYPDSLDELLRSNGDDRWNGPYIAVANLVDPCGTRLKYTRYVQDELNDDFSLRSAGEDKTFYTDDDFGWRLFRDQEHNKSSEVVRQPKMFYRGLRRFCD